MNMHTRRHKHRRRHMPCPCNTLGPVWNLGRSCTWWYPGGTVRWFSRWYCEVDAWNGSFMEAADAW
jgi:hypothetical protein